ncbi:GGDEF domain-containing protein [Thalassotalea sp. Y01]|uniref:GGDEF domain-containing protein n=1 Tax=Thalassotalea sp. Y01 TaxID=2729613 RepID=UPI00145D070E|nr:GGDEF domain-containing protein [Thalassotalea sp. Y01]NMP15020.1 GGDEF domain-containing protein [Thalassotalea sp. Y01]
MALMHSSPIKALLTSWLLALILCIGISPQTQAASAISSIYYKEQLDDLIREALEIRSNDLQRSREILSILHENNHRMTVSQSEQYVYIQAYLLTIEGKYQEAIDMHSKNAGSTNLNFRLRANANMLRIHLLQEDYKMAAAMYIITKQSLAPINRRNSIYINALITFMIFYNDMHEYKQAIAMFKKMLNSKGELPTARQVCFINRERIKSAFALNELDPNAQEFVEALRMCNVAQEPLVTQHIVAIKAAAHIRNGEVTIGKRLLTQYWPQVYNSEFSLNILRYAANLANVYAKEGDEQRAREYVDIALSFMQRHKKHPQMLNAMKLDLALSDYLSAKSRFERQTALMQFERSVIDSENEKSLLYQAISHTVEKKWMSVESFIARNKTDLQVTEKVKQEIWWGYIFAGAIWVGILLMFKYIHWVHGMTRTAKAYLRQAIQKSRVSTITSIYTREAFIEIVQRRLASAEQQQQRHAMVVVNIDMFRQFYHIHGMDIANRMLRHVVKHIRSHFPDNAVIGELGNDEYAILLPNCRMQRAYNMTEKFRQYIAETDAKDSVGFHVELTVSAGITETGFSGFDWQEILMHAEKALHFAKLEWGNTSVQYRHRMQLPNQTQDKDILEYMQMQRYTFK